MKRDSVYLAHILQEMEFIEAHFSNRPFEEIVGDDMMQRSVIRNLEVVGEASKNPSSEVGTQYPDIPGAVWQGCVTG